ncbi:hypothetical protein DNI29_04535 [Hymenobacter sediminis]|uniref:glycoside hydrolase family 19 protein n=1 Tax=Hymenobacter sediminis TaxID=2218621 RepID=UPI000DA65F0B|nr:glycoside hydrolase family 19 protein [Hymenobacter sediminis]RPD50070.1 hypothetical protein DNI29_04535 [Hymenobacter sediminis]
MSANIKQFFDSVRSGLFEGRLTQAQVQGIEAILTYYKVRYSDLESLAYILATAYHETARTMQPVREFGRGKGYDYGRQLRMDRQPYTTPKHIYYGRGLVQLTWYENYQRTGKLIGQDLLNNPDLMLQLDVSVKVLVEGMVGGWFTGKKLADYFLGPKADPYNARRIINGLDKAQLIASYYTVFLDALT